MIKNIGMMLSPFRRWLALFPQLVAWVAYTVVVGTLAGVVALAIVRPWAIAARA